ncbi:MAG: DinB family protein [Spirochaetales bacterium]|nr:DinB family protein [Spirochaetales bacterium]
MQQEGDYKAMDYYEIKDTKELLKKYISDIDTLEDLHQHISADVMMFVPEIENPWTIKEHLVHIAETEANCFLRYKRARLNPGAVLNFGGGDVETSHVVLGYNAANLDDYMMLFRTLRTIVRNEVSNLSEDERENSYIIHPDYGRCSIKFILSIYTQHVDVHMGMIQRNISLWDTSLK